MPVFRVCRHINDISGFQFDRFFSPKLTVSASCSCDKYLTAAGLGMMNVPMVSASGFKSNGSYRNLFRRKQVAIALSVEILRISVIFAAFLKKSYPVPFSLLCCFENDCFRTRFAYSKDPTLFCSADGKN